MFLKIIMKHFAMLTHHNRQNMQEAPSFISLVAHTKKYLNTFSYTVRVDKA